MMFSAQDKLECVQRELRMRKKLYPRWVEDKTMTVDQATRELALMESIVADYERNAAQMSLPL